MAQTSLDPIATSNGSASGSGAIAGGATIEDVARLADVSTATVSRVMNGSSGVREKTRQKVLDAAARLGYVANQQAKRLAGGHSQIIGLVVPELANGYVGEIIHGIDEALAQFENDLMLFTTHRRASNEAARVMSLTRSLVDGMLVVLPREPGMYLQTLRQLKFPHVLIDHIGLNDVSPSVIATNRQGGLDGTRYLLSLGHRRIGFITGDMKLGCSRDRLEGYRAALQEAGLPIEEQLIREGTFHQPEGYSRARELLQLRKRPTAIFASNDVMAFGAMEAARDLSLRIPDDVSIIGFDDIPQSSSVNPPLTTIQQPLREMGRAATQVLMDCIRAEQPCQTVTELPTQLVIRQSCAAPKSRA